MIEELEAETKKYEEENGITDGDERRAAAIKKARNEMYAQRE